MCEAAQKSGIFYILVLVMLLILIGHVAVAGLLYGSDKKLRVKASHCRYRVIGWIRHFYWEKQELYWWFSCLHHFSF
jgi:hypothetical protein